MNTHIAGRDPALAETVAWLYGKEPTQSWPDDNESAYEFGRSDNGDWHRVSVWQNGQAINITVTDTLTPDQAVEAARALLTAAEKARRMTMTRKRSPEREQFLNDLLVTAIEGGINYWAWITDAEQTHDKQGRVTGYKSVTIREKENGDQTYTITIDTMATGINRLLKRLSYDIAADLHLANKTNGDDGDFDALDADQIVQHAIFDKSVYA